MSVRSCRSLMGHCVRPGLPPQNPVTDCANPRRCAPERGAGPPMMVPPAAVWSELQMFVSLHRLNEEGHQRFETLAADPVRRLPDHNQRIADCLIIKSARGPW